jgi:hypothetical protein
MEPLRSYCRRDLVIHASVLWARDGVRGEPLHSGAHRPQHAGATRHAGARFSVLGQSPSPEQPNALSARARGNSGVASPDRKLEQMVAVACDAGRKIVQAGADHDAGPSSRHPFDTKWVSVGHW